MRWNNNDYAVANLAGVINGFCMAKGIDIVKLDALYLYGKNNEAECDLRFSWDIPATVMEKITAETGLTCEYIPEERYEGRQAIGIKREARDENLGKVKLALLIVVQVLNGNVTA